MFDLAKLPKSITKRIAGLTLQFDKVGMSGSTIILLDEMVLKIEKTSRSSENELKLLVWLDGKLPIPKIIEAVTQEGYSFLLLSRLTGEMACSDNGLQQKEDTVRALVNGLKRLWEIDISDCPCSNMISEKLMQVRYNMENKLVNTDDFNAETFEGFKGLSDLYEYLDQNRPKEDLVFSHGDFCLPNVFVSGSDVTGFINWGNGGVADRWQDIALCVRSLQHNYTEYTKYNEDEYQKYKKQLFQGLGMEPDEEKIRYFILLDELF